MYGPALYNLFSVVGLVLIVMVVFGAIWLLRPLVVRIWRSIVDANADADEETKRIWKDRYK